MIQRPGQTGRGCLALDHGIHQVREPQAQSEPFAGVRDRNAVVEECFRLEQAAF